MSVSKSSTPTGLSDFAKGILCLFENMGYETVIPSQETKGYDFQLKRDGESIAVCIKQHKAKVSIAQIQKFQSFLDLPQSKKFTSGWFLSANGFGKPALAHVLSERPRNLSLGACSSDKIFWHYPYPDEEIDIEPEDLTVKYIGVFTAKGGVGKTTIAAHLAGAFALMGHDVILVDLDPDKNLRKLFEEDPKDKDAPASLFVPSVTKKKEGSVITVLNEDEWKESDFKGIRIVICDCSPVLSQNAFSFVKKFDYCIVPTTLTPLGIAKNADVITRTFRHIREVNKKTEMFVVINSYHTGREIEKRNEVLLAHLSRQMDLYLRQDPQCRLIHPDDAKIRYSTHLLYWGHHIVEGGKPQLAFKEGAGVSYPRTDFLQLADYLENHTNIDELRRNRQD
jgi:chromosome partitioning protein